MKQIQIKASEFFDLLKLKDQSMWQVFTEMIDGEEKNIVFLDEKNQPYFNYILPKNLKQLKEEQQAFSKAYSERLFSEK